MKYYPRNIRSTIESYLKDSPAVILQGARQTGKSTLVKELAKQLNGTYYNLDDEGIKATLRTDARTFLRQTDRLLIIDEIQLLPELLINIKTEIDRNRKYGRFLLTGSANVLLAPKIADSLAGRMSRLTLQPLSRGELTATRTNIIDELFNSPKFKAGAKTTLEDYLKLCFTGGYPDVKRRDTWTSRKRWLRDYVDALVTKDIRDIADIRSQYDIGTILQLLAARAGGLLDFTAIGNAANIPRPTVSRYLGYLHSLYIYHPLPSWTINIDKRVTKSSKVQFIDPAILAFLLNANQDRLKINAKHFGMLIENLVYTELKRQSSWAETQVDFYYFRTSNKQEVDIVMVSDGMDIVGVEVKSAQSVNENDFRGLKILAEESGTKFKIGILVYAGDQILPFGPKQWAIPINRLWL